MYLNGRQVEAEHFLYCNNCHWSTRESGEKDRENTSRWPVHTSTLETELKNVMDKCRTIVEQEHINKEIKERSRRSGKFGYHLSDKFGLQTTYERRRKVLQPEVPEVPTHEPTDPPPFDESLLDGKLRVTLEEVMRQPLAGNRPLGPIRVSYVPREQYRCNTCERTTMKRQFGSKAYDFKINLSALSYTPEIMLARPVDLSSETSPILLSVTNYSQADVLVEVVPIETETTIDVVNPKPIQVNLTTQDNAKMASNVPEGPDVVNKNGNKAVIRLEVMTKDRKSDEVALLVKYKFASDQFSALIIEKEQETKIPEWYICQVKVRLV